MTSTPPERPALSVLLGGYLHQDWPEEYGNDVWAAVTAYRADEEPARVAQAAAEVRALLAEPQDDDALATRLDRLGCQYWPPGDGFTVRGWLEELGRRLAA